MEVLVVALRSSSEAALLASSGDALDVSVACATIASRLEGAVSRLGWRLVYVDTLAEAAGVARGSSPRVLLLLDTLSLYTSHLEALRLAYEAYASSPSEVVVLVTRPYVERGVRVRVSGSTLTAVEDGGDVFAGIVVGDASRLAPVLAASSTLSDLLSALRGAAVAYWPEPWLRLERPHDALLYSMLLLSRLSEQRISPRARVSPTAVIEGPVVVEEGVRIDHYAVVKGPVVLCRGSFVGMHAAVRSFTDVEEGARIGSFSETFVALLERRATLSSHTYITGSVVGEDAKVEPFVVTKVAYGREAAEILGIVAPFTPETRVGAAVAAGRRVAAGTVVKPAALIR